MSIMIVACLCLPIIVNKYYGGWTALTPETYPRPDFYRTPSRREQFDFWQFTISTVSLFTLPHLLQRTYAAKDLNALKTAHVTMAGGIWFLMVGAVYIGTMAVMILGTETSDGKVVYNEDMESPFTKLLNRVIDIGGFPRIVGLLTITASLAAITSTVDSVLVAISQLITEEIFYPLKPQAAPRDMAWVGRAVSLVAVTFAALLGYV
jgi:Na+/proline symporter